LDRLDRAAARVEPAVVVVAGIAAAAAILFVTGPHGPGLTPDSAVYVSGAEHLTDGDGLTAYGREAFVIFPPGFSLLLAGLMEIFDTSAVAAGRVANAVLLGLIIGAAWLVLRRVATSATLRVLGVLLIAGATSLHVVSSYVWSEPLFVLVLLLALLALDEAMRHTDGVGWLVVAALAASGCFFIRYIGGVVIATGCVAILVAGQPRLSGRRRVTRAALFAVIAGAGPVAWLARNLVVSDTVTGDLTGSHQSFVQHIEDTVRGLVGLAVPWTVPAHTVVLLLLCAVGAAALWQVRSTGLGDARRFALLLAGFVVLYVVTFLQRATTTAIEPLVDRYGSPIFVPLVALAVAMLDRAAAGWRERGPYWALLAPGALILCTGSLLWGTAKAGHDTSGGMDYAAERWRDSDLAATVERADLPANVYSNVPAGLFLLASVDARCWPEGLVIGTPCEDHTFGSALSETEVVREIGTEPAALVLFSPDRGGRLPVADIPAELRVTGTTDAADGRIYHLERQDRAAGR
jgi:hypothetical protein